MNPAERKKSSRLKLALVLQVDFKSVRFQVPFGFGFVRAIAARERGLLAAFVSDMLPEGLFVLVDSAACYALKRS